MSQRRQIHKSYLEITAVYRVQVSFNDMLLITESPFILLILKKWIYVMGFSVWHCWEDKKFLSY